jgi:hypothetical protein
VDLRFAEDDDGELYVLTKSDGMIRKVVSANHGSSDGDAFRVIKRGLPPTMMAGFDGRMSDQEIWNIVNYLRTLRSRR